MDLYSDKTPDSLRAHADQLDQDADTLLREANARADELRRRARVIADEQDTQRQPRECRNCHTAIVPDPLGWKHTVAISCPKAAPVEETVVDSPEATPAEGEPTP